MQETHLRGGVRNHVGHHGLVGKHLCDRSVLVDILPVAVPYLRNQTVKLLPAFEKTSGPQRPRSADDSAVLDERQNLLQDIDGHHLVVALKPQHPVSGAALARERAVLHDDLVQKAVGIEVVELVAVRQRRLPAAEQGGDVGVLTVVDENVGDIMSGLKHVAAAGHVVDPYSGLLGPGVVAVEPLPYHAHAQTGHECVAGLVGAFVYHEAVDAARELKVGNRFQVAWSVRILHCVSPRGQRLGGRDVLAVYMGDRSGLLTVGDIPGAHNVTVRSASEPGGAHPHRGHGNCSVPLDIHAVDRIYPAAFMGLGIAALHAVFLHCDFREKVVIGRDQVSDGLSPVPQECVALLGRAYHRSGEHRHPLVEVIAPAGLEFLEHRRRPVLLLGLIAVVKHILHASLAYEAVGRVFIEVKIGMEEVRPGHGVELVHLKPGGVGRCGMVLLAGQGVAETPYLPAAFGNVPFEISFGIHPVAYVKYALRAGELLVRRRGRGI